MRYDQFYCIYGPSIEVLDRNIDGRDGGYVPVQRVPPWPLCIFEPEFRCICNFQSDL